MQEGIADLALVCGDQNLLGLEVEELMELTTVTLVPRRVGISVGALTLQQVERLPGFRHGYPEVSLDQLIDLVALQKAVVLATGDIADRVGVGVEMVSILDAPPIRLAFAMDSRTVNAHCRALVTAARRVSYAYPRVEDRCNGGGAEQGTTGASE
ncbi:hypothetical protein [Rhodococcus sp. WS1]|uniref:hypothetical protein n=1 Tax=Rhodococcus sp. WS1 TaxID=1882743 RepID=UPI001143C602|nr:hypothetical protein [Rhodococcus sp. WS1]